MTVHSAMASPMAGSDTLVRGGVRVKGVDARAYEGMTSNQVKSILVNAASLASAKALRLPLETFTSVMLGTEQARARAICLHASLDPDEPAIAAIRSP